LSVRSDLAKIPKNTWVFAPGFATGVFEGDLWVQFVAFGGKESSGESLTSFNINVVSFFDVSSSNKNQA